MQKFLGQIFNFPNKMRIYFGIDMAEYRSDTFGIFLIKILIHSIQIFTMDQLFTYAMKKFIFTK